MGMYLKTKYIFLDKIFTDKNKLFEKLDYIRHIDIWHNKTEFETHVLLLKKHEIETLIRRLAPSSKKKPSSTPFEDAPEGTQELFSKQEAYRHAEDQEKNNLLREIYASKFDDIFIL